MSEYLLRYSGATWAPSRAGGLALGALWAFGLAAAMFLWLPSIDLWVSNLLTGADGKFDTRSLALEIPRTLFQVIYFGILGIAILGFAGLIYIRRSMGGRLAQRWFFLALALVIGPGLVANVALKDQMGRARPKQIEMFGGERSFTPALVPAKQCAKNCSFVSGEASSMFAVFFALALLVPTGYWQFISAALIAGGTAGLIRMAQGAHFLSDIVFAGIFMALTTALLFILMFELVPLVSRVMAARLRPIPIEARR